MSTYAGTLRLETRKIAPEALLPEDEVKHRGFAGHTFDQYPEPARSYYIAYYRLERVFRDYTHTPSSRLRTCTAHWHLGCICRHSSCDPRSIQPARSRGCTGQVSHQQPAYLICYR